MKSKQRLHKITFGLIDLLTCIICVEILRLNIVLGISMIVLLAVRILLGTFWGIPWRSGKVDWSKRQPKPKTQVVEPLNDK